MLKDRIVYDNKDEFGIGIMNLYHYQGTERIPSLNKYVDKDTITGKMIKQQLNQLRLKLGHEPTSPN